MEHSLRHALREERLHGSNQFPLATYHIERTGPEVPILDCHWHAEAEFFFVLEGEVLFQVDTDYFPVRAGEAVFIDGGDIHAGHSLNGSPCTFCAVVFDTALLESSTYDAVQQTYVTPLQDRSRTFPRHLRPCTHWEKSLLEQLEAIISACASQVAGFEAEVKGRFYLMLHSLVASNGHCNRSQNQSPDSAKIDRLKKAIGYMQLHYQRPIRIAELAEQIPMSEGQFCRFFKKMTRQTPLEYLNAYRIKRAVELLQQPHTKISAVAMDVGFGHISYFVKVFRSIMKCTPSDFRKQMHAAD